MYKKDNIRQVPTKIKILALEQSPYRYTSSSNEDEISNRLICLTSRS